MKHHVVSWIALIVAISALTFAVLSERKYAVLLESRENDERSKPRESEVPSPALARLSARLDKLERDLRAEDQLQLLTDISAQLAATAKKADQGFFAAEAASQKSQFIIQATQNALNAVGADLQSIKKELRRIDAK